MSIRWLAYVSGALFAVAACSPSSTDAERSQGGADGTTAASEGVDGSPVEPGSDVGQEGTLRLGILASAALDPAAASPASVHDIVLADLLHDTLTALDDGGVPQPDMASFSANADLTVWRFELDQGATFADGSVVTADDVVFSLDRVRGSGGDSLPALRLDDVESVVAVGPSTVDITLRRPSAVLPETLAAPVYGISSKSTVEGSIASGELRLNASGDYVAVIESPSQLLLTRRAGTGPDGISVELFESESLALDGFLAGDLDWTVAPPDRLSEVFERVGARGVVPFHGGLFLGLDAGIAPLDSGDLRRAIALAIDRQALAEAVFGPTAQAATGVVPDGVPGGGGECRGVCGPASEAARATVTETFPEGQSTPLRLLVDDTDSMGAVASVLAQQFDDVGLEVDVDAQPVAVYEQLITSGRQQLFLFGWLGVSRTPAHHLPPLFSSASPDNLSGFAEEAIDESLEATRTQPIVDVRASAWRDVEATILERVPVVPLVQFRTTGVLNPRVDGFVMRADGTLDLSALSLDG